MIDRLYVNNFRCFENFALDFAGRGSLLVIGKNGSGKSTLRQALSIFQKICRGPNRVRAWLDASDFRQGQTQLPLRFEAELTLAQKRFRYAIAFDLPKDFREARVAEETLTVDGVPIFSRRHSQVSLPNGATFGLDWHVAALPVMKEHPGATAIQALKSFFASMILIAPIPALMSGFSEEDSFELQEHAENFAAWLNALLARYPAAYNVLFTYLRVVLPDFLSFENPEWGETGKRLRVLFKQEPTDAILPIDFKRLSDGEKCFFLSATMVALNKFNGPIFCMWDEPDNHLSLPEVGHFITHLRKLTNQHSQFIATSHHPEAIRRFSDDNTLVFTRKSHLEPTIVRELADLPYRGNLIEALVRDEIPE